MQNKRRKIFKISSERFRMNNWQITLSKELAVRLDELIDLFNSQAFRLIDLIVGNKRYKQDMTDLMLAVEISSMSDYDKVTSKTGVILNGKRFLWVVGTTGGLKNNTLLFVREDILPELIKRTDCGRKKDYKAIPAKLEAYIALTYSASVEIPEPRSVLVVRDCITKFKGDVVRIDGNEAEEPIVEEKFGVDLENNGSDGMNLCTPEYMQRVADKLGFDYLPSGICLRNAYLKGMLNVFEIIKFAEEVGKGYKVKDIWGTERDIRDVDMIITESSLKLWDNYSSWEEYHKCYYENGYRFSATKVTPKKLEDTRETNYQYLQSYELTDEQIVELCKPTVDWLKMAFGGDYQKTKEFLGVGEKTKTKDYAQALYLDERMMNDPYVIDRINKMIKKKINQAKIGKLKVEGNYQIILSDPYALMQSIYGLEVTGLLKANEIYSQYWVDKGVNEVVCFRSPMTSHNNIRKMKVNNDKKCQEWYKYSNTMMILNDWDTIYMALNGCDTDGDSIYSTNNNVLLSAYKYTNAIDCVQRKGEKRIVKRSDIRKSNKKGLGNEVAIITNRVSAQIDKLPLLQKNSKEYIELNKRILCGQLYQQLSLDKLKGIICKEMPKYWYVSKLCTTTLDKAIVTDKKPYYFIYNYSSLKKDYDSYIKNCDLKCVMLYGCKVNELRKKQNLTEEQQKFLEWYDIKMPVNISDSTMNRICRYVESEFDGRVAELKSKGFDYEFLKSPIQRSSPKTKEDIENLEKEYIKRIKQFKKIVIEKNLSTEEANIRVMSIQHEFRARAEEICPNKDRLVNIMLDLCYGQNKNKYFCWAVVGDLIIENLKKLHENG